MDQLEAKSFSKSLAVLLKVRTAGGGWRSIGGGWRGIGGGWGEVVVAGGRFIVGSGGWVVDGGAENHTNKLCMK